MKKNGFIAISLIYSFFLCFIILMMGLLVNYTHSRLILDKINEPLEYEQNFSLLIDEIQNNELEIKDMTLITDFSIGEPPVDGSVSIGSGLYRTNDDIGVSYIFRGAISNNYIEFANKKWRIVRINGDDSIRIISASSIGIMPYEYNYDAEKYVGYTYDNKSNCTKNTPCTKDSGTSSNIKIELEKWYDHNLSIYDKKIETTSYCNDTSIYQKNNNTIRYGALGRMDLDEGIPNLDCPNSDQNYGGYYRLKIGLLTADEMNIVGLARKAQIQLTDNYLTHNMYSMTPAWYYNLTSDVFRFDEYYKHLGYGWTRGTSISDGVYPVINLKSDTKVIGSGTIDDPYIVK